MNWPGENQAWDLLLELDPEDVQKNASVIYDIELLTYELICFGQPLRISRQDRTITSMSDISHRLLNELGDYSRLSILNYLVNAKDVPLSGQLKRPSDLRGGDIFARGTHVLPLDEIADLYSNNKADFLSKGHNLGGRPLDYGDMSIELFPFPRVPVDLIIWSSEEEFPAKSSLLFDSNCIFQMPVDILWSTAMLTIQMMIHLSQ